MKLDENEERVFDEIIRGEKDYNYEEYRELFEKVEIGFSFLVDEFPFPFDFRPFARFPYTDPPEPEEAGLVIFTGNAKTTERIVRYWRQGFIRSLSVRVKRSWRCYLSCNNKTWSEVCNEDRASTSSCVIGLQRKCFDETKLNES